MRRAERHTANQTEIPSAKIQQVAKQINRRAVGR